MALVFPRAFPEAIRWRRSALRLLRGNAMNTLNSGAIQATELTEPLWQGAFESEPLSWASVRRWDAWQRTLRDGVNSFLAFDYVGSYPIAYKVGAQSLTKAVGGAWDETATITARTPWTLSLAGLPASYIATAGDRLSFAWGNGRAYHEVQEDAVGSAGGAITLTVEPYVREPYPTLGEVVTLIRAPIVMRMLPGTWSAGNGMGSQPISFEAVQVI